MEGLVKAALGRPQSTVMVYMALVLGALVGTLDLGLSALPEVRVPKMVVSTRYPGLPASEVRTLVTVPVESSLAAVRGLSHVESISREGTSTVTLEFQWGTDLRTAGVAVRQALESVYPNLPAGAGKPVVLPVDPADVPVAVVGVFAGSGSLAASRSLAASEILTKLQQLKGVGSVVLVGGADEEIQVSVDRKSLGARSLTLGDLGTFLGAAVCTFPAGTLTEAGQELPLKALGFSGDLDALAEVQVPLGTGSSVALGTLGRISRTAGDQKSWFSRSGTEGIGLYVHRQPGANPVEVADEVRNLVQTLAKTKGETVTVSLEFDGTMAVRQGTGTLAFDVALGALAAFLILVFFIRDFRSAGVVVVSVVVSLVLTLGFLRITGRSLNLLSLGGLALSLGMMVDHAVVIVENLHRRIGESGKSRSPAAVARATSELSLTNIGSTGTSVIVFLPIIFLPGVVGSVFLDLSLAVIGAHLASFLVSVTLVPALYLWLPGQGRIPKTDLLLPVRRAYLRALTGSVRRPWVLGLCLGVLTFASVGLSANLRFEAFSPVDEGLVEIDFSLPPGTPVPRAGAIAKDLESRLQKVPGVASAFSRVGAENDDPYFYADPTERAETIHCRAVLTSGFRPRAEHLVQKISGILPPGPWVVRMPRGPLGEILGIRPAGRCLLVTGPDPESARTLAFEAARTQGVGPDGVFPGEPGTEIRFQPDPAALARLGVPVPMVAEGLRTGTSGLVATKLVLDNVDLDVRVQYLPTDRESLSDLGKLPVRGANGLLVPVGSLGSFSEAAAGASFYRYDRVDSFLVQLPADGSAIPPGTGRDPGQETNRELVRSAMLTFALILVLVYLFLGSQLGSFFLPLLVMGAVPLSFSGIVLALVLGGATVGLPALLGVAGLVGTVVNNSILLYQVYRDRALVPPARWTSVVLGGSLGRLRPLVMTSAITLVSLVPVALDPRGSLETSMAQTLLGGLATASILTLFVIPLLFIPGIRKGHKA